MEIVKIGSYSLHYNSFLNGFYVCRIYRDDELIFTVRSEERIGLDQLLELLLEKGMLVPFQAKAK